MQVTIAGINLMKINMVATLRQDPNASCTQAGAYNIFSSSFNEPSNCSFTINKGCIKIWRKCTFDPYILHLSILVDTFYFYHF